MSEAQRTLYVLAVILIGVLCITVWWTWRGTTQEDREATRVQQEAQSFRFAAFVDRDGNSVPIAVDDGTVKVVTHWASWCAACQNDLNVLRAFGERIDTSAVRLIAINRNEPHATIDAYLSSINFETPDAVTIVIDATDAHYSSVGGYTMPETVIYSPTGNVVQHLRGPLEIDALEAAVDTAWTD